MYRLFSGSREIVAAPVLSKIGDPILKNIVAECLEADAGKRPTAEKIVKNLENYNVDWKKLKRKIRLAAILTVMAILFFMWVRIFDFFSLDTRVESYVMMIGDMFRKTDFSDQIAIIGIPDENMDKTWRRSHAALVDKLSEAGADVIVFDMFFESSSEFDTDFAESIIRAETKGAKVVLGIREFGRDGPKITGKLKIPSCGYGVICIGEKLGYGSLAPLMIARDEYCLARSLALEAVNRYRGQVADKAPEFGISDTVTTDGARTQDRQIKVG